MLAFIIHIRSIDIFSIRLNDNILGRSRDLRSYVVYEGGHVVCDGGYVVYEGGHVVCDGGHVVCDGGRVI